MHDTITILTKHDIAILYNSEITICTDDQLIRYWLYLRTVYSKIIIDIRFNDIPFILIRDSLVKVYNVDSREVMDIYKYSEMKLCLPSMIYTTYQLQMCLLTYTFLNDICNIKWKAEPYDSYICNIYTCKSYADISLILVSITPGTCITPPDKLTMLIQYIYRYLTMNDKSWCNTCMYTIADIYNACRYIYDNKMVIQLF